MIRIPARVFRIGVLLVSLFVGLGQLGRIEIGVLHALYLHDLLLIGLIFLAWIDGRSLLTAQSVRTRPVIVACGSVLGYIFCTSLLFFWQTPGHLLTLVLYLLRIVTIVLFGMLVLGLKKDRILSSKEVTLIGIACSLLITMAGFVQYLFIPDTRDLALLGWDDHYYRLISTIFDPGFTGMLVTLGILLTLWAFHKEFLQASLSVFLLVFQTTAVLLTYSRASYLSFAVGVMVFAFASRRWRILLILPVFLGAVFFLPRPGGEGVRLERSASIVARIQSNESVFDNLTVLSTLFGKGWYSEKLVTPTTNRDGVVLPNHSSAPENSYVFLFQSFGLVGIVLLLWMLYQVFKTTHLDTLTVSGIWAISVHALFTNTWFYALVLVVFALIMARNEPRAQKLSRSLQS